MVTPAPPSRMPTFGFSLKPHTDQQSRALNLSLFLRPPFAQQAADFDGYNFWRQYQNLNKTGNFFMPEPGAEVPARTTFDRMFRRRVSSPKTIHSFKYPKPLPVARQIVPDDPRFDEERLLPSVDRDKMNKLPSKFGRSKKLMIPEQKYFNGGAPPSPNRRNRRTCMAHLRGDSSSVDFNQSMYRKDDDSDYT